MSNTQEKQCTWEENTNAEVIVVVMTRLQMVGNELHHAEPAEAKGAKHVQHIRT
jgi:hypothetical protein